MTIVNTKTRKVATAALGLTLTALASGIAQAADSDLQKQVDALDQQLRLLQRKLEISSEETAAAKKDSAVVTASDKGLSFKSADSKYEIRFRGLIHADARAYDEGIDGRPASTFQTKDANDEFLMRRVQPLIEGKIGDVYGFRIQSDYGNNTASDTLTDAYLDANYHTAAKVRVGKFKTPISFENLQGSQDVKFTEKSLVSNFVPNRDIGVQVAGDVFDGVLGYTVGVFNGAEDGANDVSDAENGKDLAGRLLVKPFLNNPGVLQGLSVGLGYTTGSTDADLTPAATPVVAATGLSGYSTSGRQSFFAYRGTAGTDTTATAIAYADGDRDRLLPDFTYYYGPLGLTGEYIETKQDISLIARSEEVKHRAWNVTASYVLTGEEASARKVKPANDFNPSKGTWGAWEIIARESELHLDDDIFEGSNGVLGAADRFADAGRSAKSAKNLGVGVNWYLTNTVKLAMTYDATKFDFGGGGSNAAPLDRPDEKVFIGRVEVAF